MPNLKEVRNRIQSVRSTQQITKAMKMVAAAKLRRAQNQIIELRPYANKLNEVLKNVSATVNPDEFDNKYAEVREPKKVLAVLITSDKGLCGSFNSSIIRPFAKLVETDPVYSAAHKAGNLELLCIGKKAYEYFNRRDFTINTDYMGIFASKFVSFDEVKVAAEFVMDAFVNKKYDHVDIFYNQFVNAATQEMQREQFLPIAEATLVEGQEKVDTEYIFEPSQAEILEVMIPKALKTQFFKCVLDSNASEHGARMTAMDKATENAGDLLKELKLSYNRARQANITKEILEIVSGAEALEKSA
ncbi:MAG: ATP synthase F1 subunit gamma [Bernardetiaceae bacterium]|nr:ATP synthase F1 subunit gamma [Bernardetiaceae bacterium]